MKKEIPNSIISCILTICFISVSTLSYSQNCPNIDFSQGNFSNWQGATGSCCPINLPTPGIVNGRHTIVNAGTDPNTCGGLSIPAPGFANVAQLGNANTGAEAEGLSYTYLVDLQSALLVYTYAVVLEDPLHTPAEQPRFEIQVRDASNNIIPCTLYEIAAGGGIPGFQDCGGIRWKDWTQVGVDLTGYIGQTITIEMRTGDCSLGGHFGYGYITAECQPLEILVEYCEGDTVAALTAPAGFASYLWSTGETTQVIAINNPVPGTSTITCDIISVTGCSATLSAVINPVIVTAGFSYADNCGLVQFTDTSTCTGTGSIVDQWNWDFDDAGSTSSLQNPAHQYNNGGSYDVQLIATSNIGCIDTAIITVPVTALPIANFSTPTGCGLTNTFADNNSTGSSSPIIDFGWNFGDGNIANGTPVSHTYANSGTWNIQLVITNSDGCTDTLVQPFTNRNIPVADFTVLDVCQYDSAHFLDQSTVVNASIVDWDWTVAPGNFINDTQNPAHLYGTPGIYNVQLVVTSDENCYDTVVHPVNIWNLPVASYAVSEVCFGESCIYNNTSNVAGGAITDYAWDFDDAAFPDNGQQNPAMVYTTDGLHNTQLIVTSNHNCVDTGTYSFNVWPKPDIDFTAGPLVGCYPFMVEFDNLTTINNGTVNYTWDMGDGNPLVGGFEPSIMYPNMEHVYSITMYAVSNHGCDTSITKPNYITVHPKPTASFTYTPTNLDVIENVIRTVNLSVLGDHYAWDFGTGDGSTNFEDYYQYTGDTGIYIITLVTTTNFGCADTADAVVHIKPIFTIYIPNTFTPNDDGVNDFFLVYGYNLRNVTMKIFDRWGENLITLSGTDPVNKGWNGQYKQQEAKDDVYTYRVEVIDVFGDYHEFIGRISLVR